MTPILCSVQNPVNSYAWATAIVQIFAPIGSVSPATRLFLKQTSKDLLFAGLLANYSIFCTCNVLVGPVHGANLFHLVLFPWEFRLQTYLIQLLYVAVYTGAMFIAQRAVSRTWVNPFI